MHIHIRYGFLRRSGAALLHRRDRCGFGSFGTSEKVKGSRLQRWKVLVRRQLTNNCGRPQRIQWWLLVEAVREQRRQLSIGELCLPRALGEDSRAETALVEDPQEEAAPLLRR